jgi:hypothetical protein
MADPSQFSYLYLVDFNAGDFSFSDADNNSGNGLTPATQNVTVKDATDDSSGSDHDRHDAIGDVPNDQFDLIHSGTFNGTYMFVTLATSGDGHAGFIAQNEASGLYYFFSNNQIADNQVGTDLSQHSGELAVCFMPGTMIATPAGQQPVEALKIGDQVVASDGRAVAIRWIGMQRVAPRFADSLRLPIRVKAGAIADNVPARDLCLSPDHALFIDGVLIHAGALVNGSSIVRDSDIPAVFTYYHIETEDHSLILAEGAAAETFVDNVERQRFDNFAEYAALYPDGHSIAELPYPRAKAHRQVPQAIRLQLAARASALLGKIVAAA